MQFSTTKPAGVENNWIILCSKQIKEDVDIYLLTEDKDDEDPSEGDVKHGDSYGLVRGERWEVRSLGLSELLCLRHSLI